MNDEGKVFYVVQARSRFFGTWQPVALFRARNEAYDYEKNILGGGWNYKVDRVELITYNSDLREDHLGR